MNTEKVTAGKPDIKGAVFRAPLGTTLPTSATEALDSAFKEMGYVSDAGVVNSNSPSNTAIKGWGGDVIMDVQTEKPDTFKMAFAEALNMEVLKLVYGDDNVEGDLDNGVVIHANSIEQEPQVLVINMILKGKIAKRIVLPNCKVTAVGDISYTDSNAIAYDTTLSCYPHEDWDGDTHREFVIKNSDPSI